jgi:hypothetical protein
MFRTLTATALFALSLTTAAQADAPSLNSRIQQAVENHCAPLLGPRSTSLLYKKWYDECVTTSTAKIMARVTLDRQRTLASK